MGFKDLLGGIFKKEIQQDESFLSLGLTPDKVLASIWTFDQESVQILGFSKKSYQSSQSIVHQAAVAIDSASEKAKSDVSKVVFGLTANWFERKELTRESAKLLKRLSEDLDLLAQAFVPISAAIKNFLKVRESVNFNGVILGVFDEFLEAHLVKENEVRETVTLKIRPTVEKITSALKELKENHDIPARIVVFGAPDDSRIAEGISRAEFKGIFYDLAKIEFLKDSEIAKSVAFAQAADILGYEPPLAHAVITADIAIKDHIESKPRANELGFIEGEDILISQDIDAQTEGKNLEAETAIEDKQELAVEHEAAKEHIQNIEPTAVDQPYRSESKGKILEGMATLGWFAKIQNIFKGPGFSKKLLLGLLILLVLGTVGLFIGGQVLTSAEITIKVNAKGEEDTFDVDVKKSASNFSKDQIEGSEISSKVGDSRKAVTTGAKKVGEGAKGELTVFNWTTSETLFSQGAVVISKSGIKFGLDEEVKVASRSASTPGEKKASVTAIDLGPGGNLSGGNDFTFQQYDELLYSATNDAAFTGGDEKEVTVVSQKDLDNLNQSLRQSLENEARTKLKEQSGGKNIQDDAIILKTVKQVFDKDVEQEASLLNLDLEIEASTFAYEEEELKKYLAQKSNENAPENLEAKPDNIEILSLSAESFNGTLNLTGKFKINFVPKFDENDLKEKIAGKSVKETRAIIKEIPDVSDIEVNFKPSIFIVNTMPTNKEKISFKVRS